MKKIGILTCMNSNDVCARVSCLKAFHTRSSFFEGYGEETELAAMMTCNGCRSLRPQEPREDAGILEKLDRLQAEQIECMHVGVCRLQRDRSECPRITQICEMLAERGIRVTRGTHRE